MPDKQPPSQARHMQDVSDEIGKLCAEIIREYRWRESALYGTGGGDPASGGRTPTRESRPAENQAITAAERSGDLRECVRIMEDVRTVLRKEARKLRSKPQTVERPDQFPPLISPVEHERLIDAKTRREERGEGWGRG